jgi:hypothetical protein
MFLKKAILILFFILGVLFLRREVRARYFDPSQIAQEKKELRILLLHRNGIGEQESSARIKTACEHLGWECYICSSRPSLWERALLFHPLEQAIEAIQPDLTINFQSVEKHAPGVNFVSLSSGVQAYAKEDFDWKKYADFDAFLPTFQETDLVKENMESLGKPFHGMRWFFTCPRTSYTPLVAERIFYCGSNWDRTRKGESYKRLFARLDQTGDISIYGPPKAWKCTPRSYRGFLPFDGQSTIKAMQECGIVLVLHSESHIKGNSPTARIFEAAAACCVVISDRHPFVMEEFGDSVLYIDQESSPEALFTQIEDHLAWIHSHPSEAQDLAFKCHRIFEDRFTLEKQLLHLKEIYTELRQVL